MSCQPLRRAVEPIVAHCHLMGGFCFFFPVSGTDFITSIHKMLNFTQVLTSGLSVILFLKALPSQVQKYILNIFNL